MHALPKHAMTDHDLKELVASLSVKSDKLDAQLARTDAKLEKLASLYGGVADNQGSAAEEFFFNSLNASKQIGDLHFDHVYPKVFGGKLGQQSEYDIVLVNSQSAAIVQVKYKVHPSALDQLQKQLVSYKEHFPEYKDAKLYGGIAGFSVPDDVVQEAHARGLFVLKRQGDAFAVDAGVMQAF